MSIETNKWDHKEIEVDGQKLSYLICVRQGRTSTAYTSSSPPEHILSKIKNKIEEIHGIGEDGLTMYFGPAW